MRKQIVTVGMAFLSCFLFWGCQKQEKNPTTENLPKIIIGCDDYEPYTYVDENGKIAGSDIELATEACRRMGMEPVFTIIKWDDKDEYLKRGEVDCIWSCYTMSGREERYLWTKPYMYSRQVVVVQNDSEIQTLDDLNGKRVAVQSSTKPEEIFLKREEAKIPIVKDVYCMESMEELFAALQKKYVDAVAGHETAVGQYIEMSPGQYRILDESLQDVEVSVAFYKEGNAELVEQLNNALSEMENDGTTGSILEEYGIYSEKADGGSIS